MDAYIRFFSSVSPQSSELLLKSIDTRISQGAKCIHLLISSPGGSVFHGLSVFNYLKGIPIPIKTYNFGSVDSIGIVLYCAGSMRYSVPNARFLMHGVSFNFQGPGQADEKQMEEYLKGLKIDQSNIARVIAETCNSTSEKVSMDMHNRTTLNPREALQYGLVTEISANLIPQKSQMIAITEAIPGQAPTVQEVVFS